jgi:ribonucleotide monophosphatase NagD (HAD superfamily)
VWRGYLIDVGGTIAIGGRAVAGALAYCAGVIARVLGKPSPDFFLAGVRALGLGPDQVAMVGDDPEADVMGAPAAAAKGPAVICPAPPPSEPRRGHRVR